MKLQTLQKPRIIGLILASTAICISLVWGLFSISNKHIDKIDTSKYAIFDNGSFTYQMNIDYVEISENKLKIRGWAIKQDEQIDSSDINVVLLKSDETTGLKLPTLMEGRNDVTEHFATYNFHWSGFKTNISSFKLNLDEDYRILVLFKINDNEPILINSNKTTLSYEYSK